MFGINTKKKISLIKVDKSFCKIQKKRRIMDESSSFTEIICTCKMNFEIRSKDVFSQNGNGGLSLCIKKFRILLETLQME